MDYTDIYETKKSRTATQIVHLSSTYLYEQLLYLQAGASIASAGLYDLGFPAPPYDQAGTEFEFMEPSLS